MNTATAPVIRYKARKQRSLGNFSTSNYLSDLAAQFCPTVSIQNDQSNNSEFEKMDAQVAGHQFVEGENTIGMLKCKNGMVLKPVTKLNIGFREIGFYQKLENTTNPMLLELRNYVPRYYGTRIIDINGKKIEFLVLQNLLENFYEPCVMDVKIGRQTWDPMASESKIAKEKEKYKACKDEVGFCIPGFHVYKLSTGRLHKYDKNYGKKLNGKTVSDALNTFLNSDAHGNVNRNLLLQLLACLWKIQKWARSQTSLRLYAASLLIVYDFKVLRNLMSFEPSITHHPPGMLNTAQRKTSFMTPSYSLDSADRFSGELSSSGPMYRSSSCIKMGPVEKKICDRTVVPDSQTPWHQDFHKMRRSHSFHINYNDYLSKIKLDYNTTLEELSGKKCNTENWCSVHIIDFAHTYASEDNTIDKNFLEGIENLITIFEKFLYSWR